MAIRIITGVPGSGKTYLAVSLLVNEYFSFNKINGSYEKKKDYENTVIISNIDNLQLDHISLTEIFTEHKIKPEVFFSKSYQDKIHEKYPKILYLIDEAQQYFRVKSNTPDVYLYFEYHRHYGDDIYLITQDRKKITYEISSLAENEYRAVPRTLSVFKEMKYNILLNGEIIDRKVERPKQSIFNLYKSMTHKEGKRIKNPLLWRIGLIMLLVPIALYSLKTSFSRHLNKEPLKVGSTQQSTEKNDIQKTGIEVQKKEQFIMIKISEIAVVQGKVFWMKDPVNERIYDSKTFPYEILKTGSWYFAKYPLSKIPEDSPYSPPESRESKGAAPA